MRDSLDISVIIPFYNKAAMTLDCVRSLFEYGPSVKEVLLVSNNSSENELQEIRDGIKTWNNVRLVTYNHPFNYQKINNWAISRAVGKTILMLNNDIELRPASKGLLEKMYEKAQKKGVGIVGCVLLYGNERLIQHAGVFLLPGGQADHLYVAKKYKIALENAGSKDYPYDISKDMPMTAVTGAAQMVRKDRFDSVGGFDERFIICGGDVDLCLRMNAAKHQTWFVGGKYGYMLHKESQSRKFTPIPYSDFYWSFLSYSKGFDTKVGDPYLPLITEGMK
ncbi:MAG TPA: glycosyltransferase [Candidatus Saccharibacteria bacterium]|nr:glycosyltransferase [Candidatus Saccharibacteria bacterium]